jgi:hypothetical protein
MEIVQKINIMETKKIFYGIFQKPGNKIFF